MDSKKKYEYFIGDFEAVEKLISDDRRVLNEALIDATENGKALKLIFDTFIIHDWFFRI